MLCCGKLGIHLSGEITDTSTSVNYVFLEVSDTGIGIPPEYQEKIFTPFFRVDKSRSRAMGGAGLGLALVSEIVRQHNGQVKSTGKQQKGQHDRNYAASLNMFVLHLSHISILCRRNPITAFEYLRKLKRICISHI